MAKIKINNGGAGTVTINKSGQPGSVVINPMQTLSTPTGVTVGSATATQLTISWNPVANATNYILERSADGVSGWTQVYSGATASYTNTGLTASTAYYYRVKAQAAGYNDSSYATANGSTTGETYPAYGTLYSKSNWTDVTDFTQAGTVSATISSGKIALSSGITYSDFGKASARLMLPQVSGLENWRYKIQVNVGTDLTSAIGIGRFSANTYGQISNAIVIRYSNGIAYAHAFNNDDFAARANSGTGISISANDVIEIDVTFAFDTLSVAYRNVTTSGAVKNFSYSFDVSGQTMANCGRYTLYAFTGTSVIQSIELSSTEITNAKVMFIGDSKTARYKATAFANRFVSLFKTTYPEVIANAGSNEVTQSVLDKMNEIIALNPQRVVLNIGSNNKRRGDSLSTWQTGYSSIVTQLEAAGIEVYHLLQLNESTLTFTDYNNYITSTYSASKIINAGTVTLDADGVHPDNGGHSTVNSALLTKFSGIL